MASLSRVWTSWTRPRGRPSLHITHQPAPMISSEALSPLTGPLSPTALHSLPSSNPITSEQLLTPALEPPMFPAPDVARSDPPEPRTVLLSSISSPQDIAAILASYAPEPPERAHDVDPIADLQRREYARQNCRHREVFTTLLEDLGAGHAQREGHFGTLCSTTAEAFDAAQAVRLAQWMELQKDLEQRAAAARERLLGRVHEQFAAHDLQARRGIEACDAFSKQVFMDGVRMRRLTRESVWSLLKSDCDAEARHVLHPADLPTSHLEQAIISSLQEIQVSLPDEDMLQHRPRPLPDEDMLQHRPRPEHENATRTPPPVTEPTSLHPDSVQHEPPMREVRVQIARSEELPPPDSRLGALHSFEHHFSRCERARERQWLSLQIFYDACLGKWEDHFQKLVHTLGASFSRSFLEDAIDPLRAKDRAAWASARSHFCAVEERRAHEFQRSLRGAYKSFSQHYMGLVTDLRFIERDCIDLSERRPWSWHHVLSQGDRIWPSPLSPPMHIDPILPLSPATLFTIPRVSQPLPTAPSRPQTRSEFEQAQQRRDELFEDNIAEFRAESRRAEHTRQETFSASLRNWRFQGSELERERTAQFVRQMERTRTEWESYLTQQSLAADHLMLEFEKDFGNAEHAREEGFMVAIRDMDARLLYVIEEVPQVYRNWIARLRSDQLSGPTHGEGLYQGDPSCASPRMETTRRHHDTL